MGLTADFAVRYRQMFVGVWDSQQQRQILPDPSDPAWRDYQEWFNAGNIPAPLINPPVEDDAVRDAEMQARQSIKNQLAGHPQIMAIKTMSMAQIDNWIDATVTDLASAKQVLKLLARLCAYFARRDV